MISSLPTFSDRPKVWCGALLIQAAAPGPSAPAAARRPADRACTCRRCRPPAVGAVLQVNVRNGQDFRRRIHDHRDVLRARSAGIRRSDSRLFPPPARKYHTMPSAVESADSNWRRFPPPRSSLPACGRRGRIRCASSAGTTTSLFNPVRLGTRCICSGSQPAMQAAVQCVNAAQQPAVTMPHSARSAPPAAARRLHQLVHVDVGVRRRRPWRASLPGSVCDR